MYIKCIWGKIPQSNTGAPAQPIRSPKRLQHFRVIINGLVRSGSSPRRYMPISLRMFAWLFVRVLSTNRVSSSSIQFSALIGMRSDFVPVSTMTIFRPAHLSAWFWIHARFRLILSVSMTFWCKVMVQTDRVRLYAFFLKSIRQTT